jgi:hypothetical protein
VIRVLAAQIQKVIFSDPIAVRIPAPARDIAETVHNMHADGKALPLYQEHCLLPLESRTRKSIQAGF